MDGRILVGVDSSEGSRRALAWACEDAAARGASVEAVTVWRGADDPDMSLEIRSLPSIGRHDAALAEKAQRLVEQAVSEASSAHLGVPIELLVLEGDPAETLCRRAEGADLLVVGARGHSSFPGLLLGSVASKCVHHSPRSVVIVPKAEVPSAEPSRKASGRVVVGVDRSEGSLKALRWAMAEARARGWALEAVSVWTKTSGRATGSYLPDQVIEEKTRVGLETAIEKEASEAVSVKPAALVVEGDPAERLCEMAANADLLVVGSRGHGTLAGLLLGSASDKCVRHSPCPVAVIRH